jgi:hypothetical protein
VKITIAVLLGSIALLVILNNTGLLRIAADWLLS